MTAFRELYFHNGKCYVILRALPHHAVSDKQGRVISELFNGWKEHVGADHVLKTSTHFLYCETVPDIEWEEIPETDE